MTCGYRLNSAIDAWQMGNVYRGISANGCPGAGFKNCTAAQITDLNGYMADFLADLKRSKTFSSPGNGAFVEVTTHTCHASGASRSDVGPFTILCRRIVLVDTSNLPLLVGFRAFSF